MLTGIVASQLLLLYLFRFQSYSRALFVIDGALLMLPLTASGASFRLMEEFVSRRHARAIVSRRGSRPAVKPRLSVRGTITIGTDAGDTRDGLTQVGHVAFVVNDDDFVGGSEMGSDRRKTAVQIAVRVVIDDDYCGRPVGNVSHNGTTGSDSQLVGYAA